MIRFSPGFMKPQEPSLSRVSRGIITQPPKVGNGARRLQKRRTSCACYNHKVTFFYLSRRDYSAEESFVRKQ